MKQMSEIITEMLHSHGYINSEDKQRIVYLINTFVSCKGMNMEINKQKLLKLRNDLILAVNTFNEFDMRKSVSECIDRLDEIIKIKVDKSC